jgi:ribose 5-phosphate isomerase B|tara:strand:+ start:116 stop:550 length:435 start_codon:yes stop_codon:yes gene_type:complete
MIYIGSDHAGFKTKEYIKKFLAKSNLDYKDLSPIAKEGDDYPEHAAKVAKAVAKNKNNKGILVCGTGVGMTMAANKIKGARAVLLLDKYTTKKSRTSNDANIACLRGWDFSKRKAANLLDLFLKTPFDKKARRERRIKKLDKLR